MERRRFLAVCGLASVASAWTSNAAPPRRIAVTARKFEFVPAEIAVARGETVTLMLAATDFPHGFNMPDFGVRKDLIPGQAVEVTITPTKPGRFHYLCDNFCGDGHDKMSGILTVR